MGLTGTPVPGRQTRGTVEQHSGHTRRSFGDPLAADWLDRVGRGALVAPRWSSAVVIALLLAAITALVYVTGGTRAAMPHLFYVPIILAALPFGLPGSLTTGAVAGLLCGPLMPLDSTTGEDQRLVGWLVRAAMFLAVGAVAAVSMKLRERAYEHEISGELRDALSTTASTVELDPSLLPLVTDVLATSRFHCVYQPIYSLQSGALVSAEALTRFDVEPYRSPDRWFAAAAAMGLGTELEIAAIRMALDGAVGLPPGLAVSVNASPATVGDPRLMELVRANPDRPVTVELTEHAVIKDYHLLSEHLEPLRKAGVRIAVDDAGAGFSSLQHIVQLSPDIIKLDISLAQDVGTSPVRRALAGSLIEFTRHSGALLVVEGIEEEPDLAMWAFLGAHAVQGYLVGPPGPLPAAPTHPLITALHRRPANA